MRALCAVDEQFVEMIACYGLQVFFTEAIGVVRELE